MNENVSFSFLPYISVPVRQPHFPGLRLFELGYRIVYCMVCNILTMLRLYHMLFTLFYKIFSLKYAILSNFVSGLTIFYFDVRLIEVPKIMFKNNVISFAAFFGHCTVKNKDSAGNFVHFLMTYNFITYFGFDTFNT